MQEARIVNMFLKRYLSEKCLDFFFEFIRKFKRIPTNKGL